MGREIRMWFMEEFIEKNGEAPASRLVVKVPDSSKGFEQGHEIDDLSRIVFAWIKTGCSSLISCIRLRCAAGQSTRRISGAFSKRLH